MPRIVSTAALTDQTIDPVNLFGLILFGLMLLATGVVLVLNDRLGKRPPRVDSDATDRELQQILRDGERS